MYVLCWRSNRPFLRVEAIRKISGKIRPRTRRRCFKVRPPIGDLFFPVEPENILTAKSSESFEDSSCQLHLSGTICLRHLVVIKEQMTKQKRMIKVAKNWQKRIWQQGESHPWAHRRLTAVALDIHLNWPLRMGSLVFTVADDKKGGTMRTLNLRFFLA